MRKLPLLPLRDIIVFPHMVVPLFVGREKSIRALEEAMKGDKEVVLSAQRRAKTNDPRPEDIFWVGTVGHVIQFLRLPDGTVKVLVEGRRRVKILDYVQSEPWFEAKVEVIEEKRESHEGLAELMKRVRDAFDEYVKLSKRLMSNLDAAIADMDEPSQLADTIVAHLSLKLNDKQKILETDVPSVRLEKLLEFMQSEIEVLQVERKIRTRVKKQMERTQKEYYLNEQMQQIQKEMGSEKDEFKNEIEELEDAIRQKEMTDEAKERLQKELKKLKMMSPMSAEATVIRNYIDWVLVLPWHDTSQEVLEIEKAEAILDEDHYGLKKPKERILEFLSVHKLVQKMRGPILCLVGPPGVGKTSLARSIARSTNREFVRLSLGGVRDEAEIRGHRRTYIGAMPGKILQSLRKAGKNNPVFLLDEIDKMSMDFRGDPSSALLEVLDPEQNTSFNDHYLDLDYDLSEVMFITTANNISQIPIPLKDRMEVIEIPGYTDFEKLKIARNYLIDKERAANGIEDIELNFTDAALKAIINKYTREAGVRNLEREIASVCRKIAREVVTGTEKESYKVNAGMIARFLGPPRFKQQKSHQENEIGITHGLAWTMFGGVLLTSEVTLMPGSGKLIITGKLGDVMQESAQAAMSYVRSRAMNLGLAPDFYQKVDIHVHFPEGAAPKDGPSAGITMVTSIVSALTRLPVRSDVAMTGEITLRGNVLAIGGLKEKVLAAHRSGIRRIVIPHENLKDVRDVPRPIRRAMTFIAVEHMDDVLCEALELEHPDAFRERLAKALLPPDIRLAEPEVDVSDERMEPLHGGHGGQSSGAPMQATGENST